MDQEKLEEIAEKAFKTADHENIGSINDRQLFGMIGQISGQIGIEQPSQDDVEMILKQFDDNGDGVLQIEEFREFIFALFDHDTEKSNQKKKDQEESDTMNQSNNFFNQVKQNKETLIKSNFLELIQKAQKQKRFSIQLGNDLDKLTEQIQYLDCPFKENPIEREKWKQARASQATQSHRNYELYQSSVKSNSKYMQEAQIEKNKKGIVSVYTSITPRHAPYSQISSKATLDQNQGGSFQFKYNQEESFSNQIQQGQSPKLANNNNNSIFLEQNTVSESSPNYNNLGSANTGNQKDKMKQYKDSKQKFQSRSVSDVHYQLKQRIILKQQQQEQKDQESEDFDIQKQIQMFENLAKPKTESKKK